jgi:hypothetical protein
MASIQEFVGSRNMKVPERIGAAIGSAVQLLQNFPNSGRPGRARERANGSFGDFLTQSRRGDQSIGRLGYRCRRFIRQR